MNLEKFNQIIDYKLSNKLPSFKRYDDKVKFLSLCERAKVKPYYNSYKLYIGHKRVIPKEQVPEFLTKYINKPKHIVLGQNRLYKTLQQKYIGITQYDVATILKNSMSKQIRQPKPKTIVNKPIRSSAPNERWVIDHIFLGEKMKNGRFRAWIGNQSKKWVLCVIDHFSKFSWVFPSQTKSLDDVDAEGFFTLLKTYKPKILQGDNAFKNTEGTKLHDILSETNTMLINSTPYKPSTNGAIEKFNHTLKQLIFDQFAKQKNKIWYPKIYDLVKSYNNTYHTTIKTLPSKAFTKKNRGFLQIRSNINEQARKMVYNTRLQTNTLYDDLNVDDYVRLRVIIDPKNQKLGKQSFANTFEYDIYQVKSISKASRYTNNQVSINKVLSWKKINNKFQLIPITSNEIKQVYLSDLQKVNPNQLH